MKLSKIYSNQPNLFDPISFNAGLNVIYAEIRHPDNLEKDTHNLGKSLLAGLLDFCFLKGRSNSFFIFKHQELFEDFVFFLEIKVSEEKFLTIRRFASEEKHTLIAFKWHEDEGQDFTDLGDDQWDHIDIPFDKARSMLDGHLNFRVIDGWSYRDALSYSLRGQADYNDVFKLDKFRGQHKDWKPYIAHIMGLNAGLAIKSYELAENISDRQTEAKKLKAELSGVTAELDKIEALLEVKQSRAEEIESKVSDYDFDLAEENINRELVDGLETKISELNETRYNLSMNERKITASLKEKIHFDLEKIQNVYEEAEVYLSDQIIKDYEDLLAFNKAISDERKKYLRAELKDIQNELAEINDMLEGLNQERAAHLAVLRDRETFSKYKKLSASLVSLKADIESLNRQKTSIEKANKVEKRVATLKGQKAEIKEQMKDDISNAAERYKQIRKSFSDFIEFVLGKTAILSTKVNDEGNLDFYAEFFDDQGKETSQSDGTTYKKMLCIAYDVSVIKSYLDNNFAHFVYHDGVFENLDDRKSLKLIDTMRTDAANGLQQIITAISSDMPLQGDGQPFQFEDNEIVKLLHDSGDDGRLFKMAEW